MEIVSPETETASWFTHSAPSVLATKASGKVGRRYQFVSTAETVEELMRAGFVPVHIQTARARAENSDYAKHVIRFRHRNNLSVLENEWVPEIVLLNSHDGSSCWQIMAGVYRVICSNGMITGSAFFDVRVRHTRSAPEQIIEVGHQVLSTIPQLTDKIESMRALELSQSERHAFASSALALRYPESSPLLPGQLLQPRRVEDTSPDLWTTLNVVQENMIRGGIRPFGAKGRRRRTRAIRSVGETVRLNRGLWTLADEMERIKS